MSNLFLIVAIIVILALTLKYSVLPYIRECRRYNKLVKESNVFLHYE